MDNLPFIYFLNSLPHNNGINLRSNLHTSSSQSHPSCPSVFGGARRRANGSLASSLTRIGVWDQFIWEGGTHNFGPFCPNPRQPWKLCWRGGGGGVGVGGGLVHLFCRNLSIFSIELRYRKGTSIRQAPVFGTSEHYGKAHGSLVSGW